MGGWCLFLPGAEASRLSLRPARKKNRSCLPGCAGSAENIASAVVAAAAFSLARVATGMGRAFKGGCPAGGAPFKAAFLASPSSTVAAMASDCPSPLSGHVCVVTGASRGIGKGIALQLSEAGATVYITARNRETLERTAAEVRGRGGKCVPVICDSSREEEVAALFDRVQKEQSGRLDVLVNNAFSGISAITGEISLPFWERSTTLWDQVNNAGLRGHYLCAVYGARLMVPVGRGLIIIISSPGGLRYMFNVPYGVGKAGCDRMAADCAVELRPFGVACVALWPGLVRTELLKEQAQEESIPLAEELKKRLDVMGETPEVSGKCVVGLATDPHVMRHSGKVLLSPDLARLYKFKDVDGKEVFNYVSLYNILVEAMPKMSFLFWLMPRCISVPKWLLSLYSSKFAIYPPIQSESPQSNKKT